MTTALLLALLRAVGNIAGGVLAELTPASAAWRNWTLHAAVGVVLGVVAIEIMPEAVVVLDGWQIAAAFVSGGLFYVALNAAIENRVGDGTINDVDDLRRSGCRFVRRRADDRCRLNHRHRAGGGARRGPGPR